MANKRELKKYVNALGASICESMMVAYYNIDGIDKEGVEKAIGTVLTAVGTAKSASNITSGLKEKEYENRHEYNVAKQKFFAELFSKITTDFQEEISAALKLFNAAIPEAVKKANKELA